MPSEQGGAANDQRSTGDTDSVRGGALATGSRGLSHLVVRLSVGARAVLRPLALLTLGVPRALDAQAAPGATQSIIVAYSSGDSARIRLRTRISGLISGDEPHRVATTG